MDRKNLIRSLRNFVAFAFTVGVATVGSVTPVGAGGMTGKATEVTQLLNNLELTLMTIQDYTRNLTMAKQLAVDVMQQAKGNADPSTFQDAMRNYQSINSTLSAVNQLYGSTSNVKDNFQWRMNQFSASGLGWDSYIQRERDAARMRNDRNSILTQYEVDSMQRMKENYESVQRHQSNIQGTEGTHSAMMAMNGQMNTLLAFTNQAMTDQAVHMQNQTARQSESDAEKQRRMEDNARAMQEQGRSLDEAKKFSSGISSGKWNDPFSPVKPAGK